MNAPSPRPIFRPVEAAALCVVDRYPGVSAVGLLAFIPRSVDKVAASLIILRRRGLVTAREGRLYITAAGQLTAAALRRIGVGAPSTLRSASHW